MVNADLVTAKLVELAERLGRARAKCPPRVSDLATDRDALDLVAFNLMLAVQTCADVASPPRTSRRRSRGSPSTA